MNYLIYLVAATSVINMNFTKNYGGCTGGGMVQNIISSDCANQKIDSGSESGGGLHMLKGGDLGGGLEISDIGVDGGGISVGDYFKEKRNSVYGGDGDADGGGGPSSTLYHVGGEGTQGGSGKYLCNSNIGPEVGGGGGGSPFQKNSVNEGSSGGGPRIYCEGFDKSSGDGTSSGGSISKGPLVGGGGGGFLLCNSGVGGGH